MFKNFLFITLMSTLFFACKKDNPVTPPIVQNTIELSEDATLGKILTDADGKTLYYFSLDHDGESVFCVDDCIDAWPVFYSKDIILGDGLDKADFGEVTRADGTVQTTYKGWPLYYYFEDTVAGDTKGEAANDVWFVAKPDYSIMLVLAQLVGKDVNGVQTNLNSNYEAGDEQSFYLTDGEGNTLYRFFMDTKDANNYTEQDFSNNTLWPIYEEELGAIPSNLDKADFGTIDVFGKTQVTFKGWPLYKFQQDEKRGDNYGVGFPQPGIWPIANQFTEYAQ